jgi:hypothetical protein
MAVLDVALAHAPRRLGRRLSSGLRRRDDAGVVLDMRRQLAWPVTIIVEGSYLKPFAGRRYSRIVLGFSPRPRPGFVGTRAGEIP